MTHSVEKEFHDWRVERLIFFSDAVFAIAITLLALELKLPETANVATDAALLRVLGENIDQFLGFVISFAVIASFWMQHVYLFRRIKTYSQPFIVLNVALLFLIVSMPFTTSLISGDTTNLSVMIYAGNIALTGLAMLALWLLALRKRFVESISRERRRKGITSLITLSGVFAVSIPIASFDRRLAMYSWLVLMPLMQITMRLSGRKNRK